MSLRSGRDGALDTARQEIFSLQAALHEARTSTDKAASEEQRVLRASLREAEDDKASIEDALNEARLNSEP